MVIFVFTVLVSMVVARFSQRYVESPMIGLGNQLIKYLRSPDGQS